MKKFILLSSVIVLTILITIGCGEFIIRKYISNPYKIKNEQVLKHANEVETLVLGSSHTYYGFRPEFVKNSYNLANVSQDFYYDLFLLEKYGSICKNLKTVILPISYFTLFGKSLEDKEGNQAINYKIYMDCPYHSNLSKYNFEFCNFSIYSGKLKSLFLGSKIKCDSLGWGESFNLQDKPSNWDTTSSEEAVKRHTAKDWNELNQNCKLLGSIINYCKRHQIKLILITTPTWHTYYEKLDSKQLTKMYSLIHKIQERYNLPYYDYLKDIRFNADDFYDSDHLSNVGAKKFTIILSKEALDK